MTTIANLDAKRNVGRDASIMEFVLRNVDIPNFVLEEQERTTFATSLVVNCWTVGMHVLDTVAKHALLPVQPVIHLNSIVQWINMCDCPAVIILTMQK